MHGTSVTWNSVKKFCGWAWMGNQNPNSGWVANDDRIQNGYSWSRSVALKVWCLAFFFMFGCCLFVCLQVSVFDGCSSMEWQECVGFSDGVSSLLHYWWSLWVMWIMSLGDGWYYGSWRAKTWCQGEEASCKGGEGTNRKS